MQGVCGEVLVVQVGDVTFYRVESAVTLSDCMGYRGCIDCIIWCKSCVKKDVFGV